MNPCLWTRRFVVKKLLALACLVAVGGTGCHHRRPAVATENYPPVFAPANPLAAYKSSQTGYPAPSPRVGGNWR